MERPFAVGKVVVVADVHDDIDAESALEGGRFVEAAVEHADGWFEVGSFLAGAEADSGTVLRGSRLDPDVNAEI
jgi:hypothetical protein